MKHFVNECPHPYYHTTPTLVSEQLMITPTNRLRLLQIFAVVLIFSDEYSNQLCSGVCSNIYQRKSENLWKYSNDARAVRCCAVIFQYLLIPPITTCRLLYELPTRSVQWSPVGILSSWRSLYRRSFSHVTNEANSQMRIVNSYLRMTFRVIGRIIIIVIVLIIINKIQLFRSFVA